MTGSFALRNGLLVTAVLVGLALLPLVASDYLVLTATRMMVLAVFAVGYNALFGYSGMLSLGHALFFAAGLYGAGLPVYHLGWSPAGAFVFGTLAAGLLSAAVGALALRTIRVSFMIVTLMFAQVGYLLALQQNTITGGQEGLSLPAATRSFDVLGLAVDLADPMQRYAIALGLLALALAVSLAVFAGARGRIYIAIRENEGRTEMLGFDVFRHKLELFVLSGLISGAAGAAYGILFSYLGTTFASFQYSIEALLFTLLGGAGTLLGPLLGVVLMVTLIDRLSEVTTAYLLVVGVVLIALVLWFPKGILGTIRERWAPWLI